MKKKILSGVFALVLLATAGLGVHKSMKSDADLSDLALANVEALAENESGGSYSCEKYCKSENGWICRIYSNGVLMNTCYEYRKK